jgi:hypothetical protein
MEKRTAGGSSSSGFSRGKNAASNSIFNAARPKSFAIEVSRGDGREAAVLHFCPDDAVWVLTGNGKFLKLASP